MAIQGSGLTFFPLWWVFHDNWRYYRQFNSPSGTTITEFDHYGHMHFFMMGYDWDSGDQNAFYGKQTYNFSLEDLWGPRSRDRNQQQQYRIVGRPKWYFHIQEVWRRVYIQPWDLKIDTDSLPNRRGLKWDACAADKRFGPFREGRGASPAYFADARTIPIDYHTTNAASQTIRPAGYIRGGAPPEDPTKWYVDFSQNAGPVLGPFDERTAAEAAKAVWLADNPQVVDVRHRTNWLGDMAAAVLGVEHPEINPPYDPRTFNPRTYDLQHGNYLYAGGNTGETPHPAAKPTFSDTMYIWPIIEYQTVTQLEWSRYPGAQANDVDDENFGDGFNFSIELPLKGTTGKYLSPFTLPGTDNVRPAGEYPTNAVPTAKRLRFADVKYDDPENPPAEGTPYYYDSPLKLPPEKKNQLVSWQNPYGDAADGRWVQQFLGGIVQARALVTLEHKLGGRQEVWVNATNYKPSTKFAGKDQAQPA